MKISHIRDAIYNKVWHLPKTCLSETLKRKCEALSHKQRVGVVTILLSVFILSAFFAFGHACYRMGQGHSSTMQVSHIKSLDVITQSDAHEMD